MSRLITSAGLAYFLNRQRNMSNQERVNQPPPFEQALAIARHDKVPLDSRILALHWTIDLAYEMRIEEGDVALSKIVEVLQNTFNEGGVPASVFKRIAVAIPSHPAGQWAEQQVAA